MKNKNTKWANKVVDILCNLGIEYACICPGSRNSSLTYAIISSNIKCSSHIDERSASFFALGISKTLELHRNQKEKHFLDFQ